MKVFAVLSSLLIAAAGARAADEPAILGFPADLKPGEPLTCNDDLDDWYFDLGDRYRYLPFRSCAVPDKHSFLGVPSTETILYFLGDRLIGGEVNVAAGDTRDMRLALRKTYGIPEMDDGRFLENELYVKDGFRFTYSYSGDNDGLMVVEYLDRIGEIADATPRSDWDDVLDKALVGCTAAFLQQAPGDASWGDRSHPWTYPYILRAEKEGERTRLYLTAHDVDYDDEYGFAQELPEFGCSFDVEAETPSLTVSK